MRNIILDSGCDRAMLYPQPTKYADNAQELINALVEEGPWDEVSIWLDDKIEIIGAFLRDNPQYCPKRLDMGWCRNHMSKLKIQMWLAGKTEFV